MNSDSLLESEFLSSDIACAKICKIVSNNVVRLSQKSQLISAHSDFKIDNAVSSS